MAPSHPDHIDQQTLDELAHYGFEPSALDQFRARLVSSPSNAVTGVLALPEPGDVTSLPKLGTPERRALREAGLELLRAKKVGIVILAGGMATRFGGVVKAVVPVLGDASFLELKRRELAALEKHLGLPVPTFVMSSFATHATIEAHLAQKGLGPITVFPQFVSLRLSPDGSLFREADGSLSPYATGHGDLTFALRRSGVLSRFREAGGQYLVMSNVDNLGASLDPALIALHVASKAALTAEVVRKEKGDKGGAPARLDGVPQIIEGFRFPADFDQDRIQVFNTNTFVLDAAAIDRDFDLPFYRVEKVVEGKTAVQFERLVGELTALLPTRFVEVEREGADGRFLPAKDPQELARRLPMISQVMASTRATHG